MLDKLIFREATLNDLKIIINLISDDILGKDREDISKIDNYKKAFKQIKNSSNQKLMVVEFENNVIGCCEISILHSLTFNGSTRLQVEAVHIYSKYQGMGVGKWLFAQINSFAKNKQCKIIQLTTNTARIKAYKFYKNLGFIDSHLGMKLYLD